MTETKLVFIGTLLFIILIVVLAVVVVEALFGEDFD
jgi:hypothetical protein